ncbi:L,D-transpeptidase catalytic domain [compost metagenome]
MRLIYFTLLLFMATNMQAQTLAGKQLTFERVKKAYNEKWTGLRTDLVAKKIGHSPFMIINAYKAEGKLEIWLKNGSDKVYQLFKTYDFCEHSGTLGPKVIEGDGQTPEGFYYINVFNPMSNFHLSLGINYPNSVDNFRTGKDRKTGGDIYIHGSCVTVGCIPLTDEKIKEVYLLAMFSSDLKSKKVPVNIYPFKMTDQNMKKYSAEFPTQVTFWKSLQPVFLAFEQNKTQPNVNEVKGEYLLK